MKKINSLTLSTMVAAYKQAIHFTEDNLRGKITDSGEGTILPDSEFSDDLKRKIWEDCESFLNLCLENGFGIDSVDPEQMGHDFWLTRNHHGVGFWDRPEIYGEEFANKLTNLAHSFGEINVHLGDDDGLIYS